MKNRIFQLAIVAVLVTVGLSVSAAGGNRMFDDYTITEMQHAELFTGVDAAWTLTYDNQDCPILISFTKNKDCKTYVVRGDHFEVVYECTEDGFGARMVKKSESMFPRQLNTAVLNSEELARQRILTPNRVTDERALALIAAFLPDLVNPSYQHLLN